MVSQFPPCNAVNRWNFPTRNGVMSGLSLATIIMEAGESSGALKQADYALKQGRDVLIPQSADFCLQNLFSDNFKQVR